MARQQFGQTKATVLMVKHGLHYFSLLSRSADEGIAADFLPSTFF